MKNMLVLLILFIFPLAVYGQKGGDWQFSASAGANIASMDAKMQMWDGDSGNMEDYTGYVGAESHFALKIGRIETSYNLQYYFAKKDGKTVIDGVEKTEVGDIDFYNELIDVSYYILDEPILTGFTFNVGIGKGTTRIEVERTIDGVEQAEVRMYGKVLHYFGSLHYEILDWLFAKATYRALNINTVDQPNFSNSSYTLNLGVKF